MVVPLVLVSGDDDMGAEGEGRKDIINDAEGSLGIR